MTTLAASRTPGEERRPDTATSLRALLPRLLLFGLLAFLLFRLVTPTESHHDGPLKLAGKMLHGEISFAERCTWWEMYERAGRFYLVYSPMSSVLLVPYALAGGLKWGMPVANTLILLAATALLWSLFRRVRYLRPWADVAAVAYLCGTPHLYSVATGNVWLLIHSQGNLFLIATLLAAVRRRWLWVGFCFAMAVCCRNALFFSVPFLLPLLWRGRIGDPGNGRRLAARAGRAALGALPPLALAFCLNLAMTGNPWVTTYRLCYDEWKVGSLYGLEFFWENFRLYTTAMPEFFSHAPYVRFPKNGQAFWVVSPFFLLLLRARLHTRFQRALLVGAVCGFTPYFFFIWNGYEQYGSRYVTDVFPFLLPLAFSAASRLRTRDSRSLVWMVVFLSVLINVVAVVQRMNGLEPVH